MVWNCSIVAVTLLFGVSGKSKAFRNESKTIGENDRAEYGKGLHWMDRTFLLIWYFTTIF